MLKDFLDKANSIHNNFYNYSLVDYKNNKTKVKIICPIHGEFEQTPINHTNGQGCRKCYLNQLPEKNRKSQDKLFEEFYLIHKNKYNYSLVHYKNNLTNIKIICPIHGEFEQTPKNHINGHGCPACAIEYKKQKLSKSNQNFINESKNKHNNFYNYDKTNYVNCKTKVIVTCPIHGDFQITPTHHLFGVGVGCTKCSNNHVPTNDEFIIKANEIHKNKYDYSLIEYKNNKIKIKIICPIHGEFEQRPTHHLLGAGCQKCNSSKGEMIIRSFLDDNLIHFEEQKRFIDCRFKNPLPFDFYLSDLNICIEFDGEHHFFKKFNRNLNDTIRNDKIKNDYCNKNNISLIRISYEQKEKINEILTNKLNKNDIV